MLRWYTGKADDGQSASGPEPAAGATETAEGARAVPWWVHAGAVVWITGMLLLAGRGGAFYDELVQEDRFVEWWTAFLFLAASACFAVVALRGRRLVDAGVALFCLAAAGEEVSWGQRILGFVPPDTFLARNAQQEANLHNLVEPFGQPKWTLVAVLVAYGVVAPLVARTRVGQRLAARLGGTVVPAPLALWFAVTTAVLVWYPVRFTGEWVEALAGALFLFAAPVPRAWTALLVAATAALSLGAQQASTVAATRPELVACARAEVRALLADVAADPASPLVDGDGSVHRRLWTLWEEDELDPARAVAFRAAPCAQPAAQLHRRRYGVDPWGTAYWVRAETEDGARRVTVYSFGPNRRRDERGAGDDIAASGALR